MSCFFVYVSIWHLVLAIFKYWILVLTQEGCFFVSLFSYVWSIQYILWLITVEERYSYILTQVNVYVQYSHNFSRISNTCFYFFHECRCYTAETIATPQAIIARTLRRPGTTITRASRWLPLGVTRVCITRASRRLPLGVPGVSVWQHARVSPLIAHVVASWPASASDHPIASHRTTRVVHAIAYSCPVTSPVQPVLQIALMSMDELLRFTWDIMRRNEGLQAENQSLRPENARLLSASEEPQWVKGGPGVISLDNWTMEVCWSEAMPMPISWLKRSTWSAIWRLRTPRTLF